MGLLIVLQVVLDLGFIAAATWLLIDRSKSKTMEDPRLSRGLQLLSSKIAILQDLMDRSESMSKQLNQLIDGKQADIQERMEEVEVYLHKIERATEKSQEVVEIFQDRVPHQEILERQTTIKYLQAAKMAHQGVSIEDIARQVDIPRGELDLIVKVNRDRLIVEQGQEPAWAFKTKSNAGAGTVSESHFRATESWTISTPAAAGPVNIAVAPPQNPALQTNPTQNVAPQPIIHSQQHPSMPPTPSISQMAPPTMVVPAGQTQEKEIRPVIFKRISVIDELG